MLLLPAAAALIPPSAFTLCSSADGSTAPLAWSRMKYSLPASSQPKSLLLWPTALSLSAQLFSQCINQHYLTDFSDTALSLPQYESTHPICAANFYSPGKTGLHLQCPSLLPSSLEEQRSDNKLVQRRTKGHLNITPSSYHKGWVSAQHVHPEALAYVFL